MQRLVGLLAISTLLLALVEATAQEPRPAGIRVNNLKVLSDKIDDITTVENVLKSFTKPGMSDADKAKGIWTAAVKYRHQTAPPNEHLAADWEAHDPIKLLNTYGYCMCCCCSSIIESLNRADGREARGRILTGHSVPEVSYGGGWHMYDCSLITYFPKRAGGVASVDEISEAVSGWYTKNPGYKGNGGKLEQFMRQDGWTGYKKGPELLADCPFYNLGWFPAKTHGWNATMSEYDRKCEVYEYGYQVGHRSLFSLRPGESFVREAGNRGLHVNGDPNFDQLKKKAPQEDLVYLKDFLPGYNGGVVGNGYHRYAPNLAAGELAAGADGIDNLTSGNSPALRLKSAGKGVAVVAMTSPYVYLGGRVKLKAVRKTDADQVTVSLSTNNGRTFRPIWKADKTGMNEATVELGEAVLRRYAYWLKIEMAGSPESVGLDSFAVENDIQHAPRTITWLGKGSNTITVAADSDPAITSRTVTCRITPDLNFTKNESTGSMGVTFDNLDVKDGGCWWKGGTGRMTVPLETPGDLVALRFGAQVRARSDKDVVKILGSFDDGKTWTEMAKIAGPTPGRTEYFKFAAIPAGTRKSLVRYEMTGNNTVGVFNFRIDADYRDPLAVSKVQPFEVVHRWKENGQEKTNTAKIDRLPFSYKIEAGDAPEMISVTVQMPGK